MGVYNPKEKMPKSCRDCGYVAVGTEWAYCWAQDRKAIPFSVAENTRDETCPLVEVKAPHGMLIDAERLKEDIAEWGFIGESCAREAIDDAPIVIEAEVESDEVLGMRILQDNTRAVASW